MILVKESLSCHGAHKQHLQLPVLAHISSRSISDESMVERSSLARGQISRRSSLASDPSILVTAVVSGPKKQDAVFLHLLKGCAQRKDLSRGIALHADIQKRGLLGRSCYLGSTLVSMYAKCGALAKAQQVLEELPIRDVVSWNALISGYVQKGEGQKALNCYEGMQREGLSPDGVTLTCIFKACASIGAIDKGIEIHHSLVDRGLLEKSVALGNSLIDMYAKCGMLANAQEVLEELPKRDVVSWSALIAGYAQEGRGHEALHCFETMQRENITPNEVTFTCILTACGGAGALDKGKQIHEEIVTRGLLKKNVMLGTALVDMYAKCGMLSEAQQVLEELQIRNFVSWSSLIAGYAKQGQWLEVLTCFERLQREDFVADEITLACILKACGNMGAIEKGIQIHNQMANRGLFEKYDMLGNAVVDMYVKCGMLKKAHDLLKEFNIRDLATWSALIAGYVQKGHAYEALKCFSEMQREGLSPDGVTLTSILKACGNIGAIDKGKQIHDEIISRDLLTESIVLGTALIDMYAKCGVFTRAEQVLEELPVRNVVSWSALISGYTQQEQCHQAVNCFERMLSEGIYPDVVTFACILKVCGSTRDIGMGQEIHIEIINRGLAADAIILSNALLDMYVKCGELTKAQNVLEDLTVRDVVSWSTLITGYAQEGKGHEALQCFLQMQIEGIPPDGITFTCILNACGSIGAVDKGKEIHDEILSKGLLTKNVVLGAALVNMYAKCGMLLKAQQVLEELPTRNAVAWSALISGHAEQGQCLRAISCFERMQKEGFSSDNITLICILRVCGDLKAIDKGRQIHSEIVYKDFWADSIMLGTALVDMYAKCGLLLEAQKVFQDIPDRSVVTWNALIAGYAQEGKGHEAFSYFAQMKREGLSPNVVTLLCTLKACGSIGAVDEGIKIHDEIAGVGLLQENIMLATALVDMYAKCGWLGKAAQVLDELPIRDTVSWSALIAGYAQKGHFGDALSCFAQMHREGIFPNEVTFVSVLSACSHTGKFDEAQTYYEKMSEMYGIIPKLEHHACMIVNFGRAGDFDKVMSVIKTIPSFNNLSIWLALLGSCRKWGNVLLGRSAFDKVIQLDNSVASAYVLMANIYATAGMQEDAEKIEDVMKKLGT